MGELIINDLLVDFKIPEVYRTLEVNNTVTRSVRQRMLFATVGVRTDFNHFATPVFEVAFIHNRHRSLFGLEVGVDQEVSVWMGGGILR